MESTTSSTSSKPFRIVLFALGALAAILAVLALMGRLNSQEPVLYWCEFEGAQPMGGEVELWVTALDYSPGIGRLELRIDDSDPFEPEPVVPGEEPALRPTATHSFVVDTTKLTDGPHKIALEAWDRSLMRNRAQAFEILMVDNSPPILEPVGDAPVASQGRTHALVVRADEELTEFTASLFGREVAFYPLGDEGLHRALIGFGVAEEPGPVDVALKAVDRAGNSSETTVQVQLDDVRWPSGGYIALSSTQAKAQKEKDKGAEANAKRAEAYGRLEPEQLWGGPFQRPAAGPVTSPFGKVRTYSTGAERHHLGVDIANSVGTPVVAPAAGVVTLAEDLHVYGNAVILSHGHGISSSYNHLDEIHVQVGDQVEPGHPLGAMGSTGQSTGSHLHWGMVANGIAVDPLQWLDESFEVEGAAD